MSGALESIVYATERDNPFLRPALIAFMRHLSERSPDHCDVTLRVAKRNVRTGEWWSLSWTEPMSGGRQHEMCCEAQTLEKCVRRAIAAQEAKERQSAYESDRRECLSYSRMGHQDGDGI